MLLPFCCLLTSISDWNRSKAQKARSLRWTVIPLGLRSSFWKLDLTFNYVGNADTLCLVIQRQIFRLKLRTFELLENKKYAVITPFMLLGLWGGRLKVEILLDGLVTVESKSIWIICTDSLKRLIPPSLCNS
jgi:hypothetical protein